MSAAPPVTDLRDREVRSSRLAEDLLRDGGTAGAEAGAPTDRPQRYPEKDPVGRFGIDTIALRGPVDPDAFARLPSQRIRRTVDVVTGECIDVRTSSEGPTGSGYQFRVDTWRGQPEVRVELSVPRAIRGNNRLPASPVEVHAHIVRVHREIGQWVPWRCTAEELEVMRLDIARDFVGVTAAARLLSQLAIPVPRAVTHSYLARRGGGVQTLNRETDRWVARMYDRGEQYRNKAEGASRRARDELKNLADDEEGVVRFELELKRELAGQHGAGTVGALLSAPLATVARRYFAERCGFGETIAGAPWKFAKAVGTLRAAGTYKSITGVAGQLALDALDLPPAASTRTVRGYRASARSLGLAPTDFAQLDRDPVRFSFDLGQVVPVLEGHAVAEAGKRGPRAG